jgi:hypothetical protein
MAGPKTQAQGQGTGGQRQEEPGSSLVPAPPRQAGVERFDDAIVVTRARAWIGLAACLALVLGVVVWSMVATINRTVTAQGIGLVNGPLSRLLSPAAGTFLSWTSSQGSAVKKGQVVAWIETTQGRRIALPAPVSGEVLLHQVGSGGQLYQGQVLGSFSQVSGQYVVIAFLPVVQSQLVAAGDRVVLSTTEGQSGPGQVVTVDPLPLVKSEIADALGSQALADLVAPGSPGVAISIFTTPPTKRLSQPGEVLSVTIIVGSSHPINYVF